LRAKPEFFRVPLPARSKGSPQGQDWLGAFFLFLLLGTQKKKGETGERKGMGYCERNREKHD
jgi:hypothetical protein